MLEDTCVIHRIAKDGFEELSGFTRQLEETIDHISILHCRWQKIPVLHGAMHLHPAGCIALGSGSELIIPGENQ